MRGKVLRNRRYRRRAGVVVHVAIASTLVIGMGALAVDIAYLYTAQTELQVSADAAALAAASQLVGPPDVQAAAYAAALDYASRNKVGEMTPWLAPGDVEFGRAELDPNGQSYTFQPTAGNWNACRITLGQEMPEGGSARALSVPLAFAQIFGASEHPLQAQAAAVLVPRDIAVVIDLSNSMGYDSQLRFWNRTDGGYSNLHDVWCALDDPEPSRPYIPGPPDQTEYATDTGPAVGGMDVWGDYLLPGYNPVNDPGLFDLPKGYDWSGDAALEQELVDFGYDEWERWAILTNETQGYLTPPATDPRGFTSRVIWEEDSGEGTDRVTIYVTSDDDESTEALSNIVFELPVCALATADSTAGSGGGHHHEAVNPDPHAGVPGLKYELVLGESGAVETEWFSFEVPSSCNLSGTDVFCKSGSAWNNVHHEFVAVDPANTNRWRYRVAAARGLAHWDSGMDGSGGNGNGLIDGNELAWIPKPFACWNWSWTEYIDFPANNYTYSGDLAGFRNKYGLKTFVDFLLDKRPQFNETCNLHQTPQEPLRAVKDAVLYMMQEIDGLDSMDQVSLQVFALTAHLEVDLTQDLYAVSDRLYEMQTGHYDRYTNMGGGLEEANYTFEKPGTLARDHTHKVIVLMSDGKANVDAYGNTVGDGAWAACEYAREQARHAAQEGYKIYTVSVGYAVDRNLMVELAQIGDGEEFYAVGDPSTYSEQLREIFRQLGGKRPVALIQ